MPRELRIPRLKLEGVGDYEQTFEVHGSKWTREMRISRTIIFTIATR